MSKKNGKNPVFQGRYVNDITNALIVSAVSAEHALLIGAPGWGKTAIGMKVACRMTDGRYVFIRLDGSTPPEKVAGMADPAKMLASPPVIEYVKEGTVYDPDAKIIMLDEIGRPMDPIFDILLDPLNRVDVNPDDAPVVWGTTNFMPSSDRTAALRDRIALWVWVTPDNIDTKDLIDAVLDSLGSGLDVSGKIPTWKEIEEIRTARAGKDARAAIKELIDGLKSEAMQSGIDINPRRETQWTRILFRAGVYYSGSDNFASLPSEASDVMKYAYPTTSLEEWNKWREIASVAGDVVGAAINQLLQMAYRKFTDIRDQVSSPSGRAVASVELGEALANAQRGLRELSQDDPRIDLAMQELTSAFASIVRGEDPIFKEV